MSAEDQKVNTWVNPNSGIQVSYEPFDPFATPAPLQENTETVKNKEYLDSLTADVQSGKLSADTLRTTLEVYYKDSANKEQDVKDAMAYIEEQTGGFGDAEATETPEINPLATDGAVEYPQDKGGSSATGWIIGGVLVLAAGGGYYWYSTMQRKRRAAQRAAQKKAQAQRNAQQAPQKSAQAAQAGQAKQQAASRMRTGTYTDRNGSVASRPDGEAKETAKPYGKPIENPYGRYTSGSTEEENKYTASFKPEEPESAGSARRRTRTGRTGKSPANNGNDGNGGSDDWE